MGHLPRNVFTVYLKFTFNWVSAGRSLISVCVWLLVLHPATPPSGQVLDVQLMPKFFLLGQSAQIYLDQSTSESPQGSLKIQIPGPHP